MLYNQMLVAYNPKASFNDSLYATMSMTNLDVCLTEEDVCSQEWFVHSLSTGPNDTGSAQTTGFSICEGFTTTTTTTTTTNEAHVFPITFGGYRHPISSYSYHYSLPI
eukprot:GHVR01130345.1.p2 GENE.GHVR01130345.1~~GHVR01130345.1.p2  ORF type:complete len:108 (+),score=3.47 GHVR01130345.1:74-397(+)